MASKKAKAKKTGKKTSLGVKAVKGVAGKLLGGESKGGGGKKSRKKTAAWYANQIARLKLKKRYDKLRLSV